MPFKLLDKFFKSRPYDYPLNLQDLPIEEIAVPSRLVFALIDGRGDPLSPAVKVGDGISPGQPLASGGQNQILASPVAGKVLSISRISDIRGGKVCEAILVEPGPDKGPSAFPPLDPEKESLAGIIDRVRAAGIVTDARRPLPLLDVIGPYASGQVKNVVILAADREPGVCASLQLYRERGRDIGPAAAMIKQIAQAERIFLALPKAVILEGPALEGVDLLPLPAEYPETLEPLVALRAGSGDQTRVLALETVLAVLDAVKLGKVQDRKVITAIGPDNKALGNFRVAIGHPLGDLLGRVGLDPAEKDKVVAGGPMGGFSQFALDCGIDAGVDALMVIPESAIVPFGDEPCINCGLCVDACPVHLQVQLIGRYAEFGFFDRAVELGLEHCIDCGLCAAVCTGRRPLTQYISLAKKEWAKKSDPPESEEEAE